MRIDWDQDKDLHNYVMHGVRFETAALVFDDPFHISKLDRIVDGEERWQTMGQVGGLVTLVVAHTYSEENGKEAIRIISARKATRREREYYEEKND
jgi:uncharacterized DUF497 family protein